MGVVAVSTALKFKLRGDNWQHPANELKFGLGGTDTATAPAAKYAPVSSYYAAHYSPSASVGKCFAADSLGDSVSSLHELDYGVAIDMANCYAVAASKPPPLAACYTPVGSAIDALAECYSISVVDVIRLGACAAVATADVADIANCAAVLNLPAGVLKRCVDSVNLPVVGLQRCVAAAWLGQAIRYCLAVEQQPSAVPVCEWHDIPVETLPPDNTYPCGLPPPANELYFKFRKPNTDHDSDKLPFRFRCVPSPHPIIKSTYMIYNEVTATCDGVALTLLSLNLSTSVDSFCWSASIAVPPEDFDRIDLDGRNDDAVVSVFINGSRWDFLIEEYSDTRQFINYSYTLKGRSITAKLSIDYASRKTGVVSQAQSTAQLAQAQLSLLPYTLEYQAVSWLVPADTYTIADATPVDTIMDIAEAGGNFVESHPFEPKLFIKKRYPVGAWNVASQAPVVTAPASLVLAISGQKRLSDKCNSVIVTGSGNNAVGGLVRRVSAGSYLHPEASALTHELYTHVDGLRSAGIAALSSTGTHKSESVTLPWDDTLQLPLGELGQIWSFKEPVTTNGYNGFKGIITGVSVAVELDNDAVAVTQTLTVDRYLDD